MKTYLTRRERIEAEKKAKVWARRKKLSVGIAGVTSMASATFLGLAPANAAMDDDFGVGPTAGSAATTEAASTASVAAEVPTYTITSGDTLSAIASEQNVSLQTLLDANDLAVTDTIYPGQVLKLSVSAEPASADTASAASVEAEPLELERTSSVTTASAPASSASGWAGAAIDKAVNIVNSGARYVYGANGPSAYDCSAFTKAAFAAAGKTLPRTSASQFAQAPQHVSLSNLQAGDLIFWSNNGSGSGIYHVAMYIGDGKIAQARNPRAGITIDNLSTYTQYNPPLNTAARY